MAIKTETKTIQGDTYRVTQFPSTTGIRVGTEVLKIIGPALADALTGDQDAELTASLALRTLVGGFESEKVVELVKAFAEVTSYQHGNKGDFMPLAGQFDVHFAGAGLTKLVEWLKFSLEVQFGDFTVWLSNLKVLESLAPKMTTPDPE